MCEVCDMKNQGDRVIRELSVLKQKIDIATAQFTLAVEEQDKARQDKARDEVMRLTGQSFDKYAVLVGLRTSMQEAMRQRAEDPIEDLMRVLGGHRGGHGPH